MNESQAQPPTGGPINLFHVQKLKEEQEKALSGCCQKIKQWEQFRADYEVLQNRLQTLPDRISYDVMVPFGSMALMPGQLVHTNEITVLLGDNWFVERSAKQASEIVGRRIKQCDITLEDLHREEKQLKSWLGYTEMIEDEARDTVEIVEEFDEENESRWNEQHRRNVQQYHQQLRKDKPEKSRKLSFDDEVFRKLENAEQDTERSQEEGTSFRSKPTLVLPGNDGGECSSTLQPPSPSYSDGGGGDSDISPRSKARRVSWQDQTSIPKLDESEEEEEEEEEESESSDEVLEPLMIYFTHTGVISDDSSPEEESPSAEEEDNPSEPLSPIRSPADLYTHFASVVQKPPKSILKKPTANVREPDSETQPSLATVGSRIVDPETVHPPSIISPTDAVADMVVEHTPTDASAPSTSSRPMSRFKSQRQASHR